MAHPLARAASGRRHRPASCGQKKTIEGEQGPQGRSTLVPEFMRVPPQNTGQGIERIRAEMESDPTGSRVRITAERLDELERWYLLGSVSFPLSQLPLLEQALAEMKAGCWPRPCLSDKIVPFPGPVPDRGKRGLWGE